MASVADLLEPEVLRVRAGEYLVRAGDVLRDSGAVRIVEFGPTRVTASVADRVDRSVVLIAREATLDVSCTCDMPSATGLCPHVVAVAIETWFRSPNREAP